MTKTVTKESGFLAKLKSKCKRCSPASIQVYFRNVKRLHKLISDEDNIPATGASGFSIRSLVTANYIIFILLHFILLIFIQLNFIFLIFIQLHFIQQQILSKLILSKNKFYPVTIYPNSVYPATLLS